MSRAVVTCSGFGQPEALRKTVLVMPSWRAFSVIMSAKAASLPAIPSATTMVASLPDCTMMPRIKSSIRTRLPTRTNIFDPCIFQAFLLTGKVSSSDRLPFFSFSKSR